MFSESQRKSAPEQTHGEAGQSRARRPKPPRACWPTAIATNWEVAQTAGDAPHVLSQTRAPCAGLRRQGGERWSTDCRHVVVISEQDSGFWAQRGFLWSPLQ